MKVSVYTKLGGGFAVLVQASPGKGRPPILLTGITLANIKKETLPVVKAMRLPKGEKPPAA